MSRITRGVVTASLASAALSLSGTTSAQAAQCGHLRYHYRVSGVAYYALFAGPSYHDGIDAEGLACSAARRLVAGYARVGFRGALGRTDFVPRAATPAVLSYRV